MRENGLPRAPAAPTLLAPLFGIGFPASFTVRGSGTAQGLPVIRHLLHADWDAASGLPLQTSLMAFVAPRVNGAATGMPGPEPGAGPPAEIEAHRERAYARLRDAAQDVADAMYFLVSPQSRFVTGIELHVNGGWYMG